MSKFLPNQNNRRHFPAFACFCVASVGVALGFVASAFQVKPLYLVALVITVSGVAGGFVCIIYVWWAVLAGPKSTQ
jgi:CHASE2 domain-containing sensor protein